MSWDQLLEKVKVMDIGQTESFTLGHDPDPLEIVTFGERLEEAIDALEPKRQMFIIPNGRTITVQCTKASSVIVFLRTGGMKANNVN